MTGRKPEDRIAEVSQDRYLSYNKGKVALKDGKRTAEKHDTIKRKVNKGQRGWQATQRWYKEIERETREKIQSYRESQETERRENFRKWGVVSQGHQR